MTTFFLHKGTMALQLLFFLRQTVKESYTSLPDTPWNSNNQMTTLKILKCAICIIQPTVCGCDDWDYRALGKHNKFLVCLHTFGE